MLHLLLIVFVGFIASVVSAMSFAGTRDLVVYLAWTIPLLLVVGVASNRFAKDRTGTTNLLRGIIVVAFGAIFGLVWGILCTVYYGPWAGAFSMPYTVCWISGGMATSASALIRGDYRWRQFSLTLVILAASIGLSWGIPYAARTMSNATTVNRVYLRHKTGNAPLKIFNDPIYDGDLNVDEVNALKKLYPTGTLTCQGSAITGSGRTVRLIIVMSRPLARAVSFNVPKGNSLIVAQQGDDWVTQPADYDHLDRSFTLSSAIGNGPAAYNLSTNFEVENADGSRTGGSAFSWH